MWLRDLLIIYFVNLSHLWVLNNMLIHAPGCVSAHNRVWIIIPGFEGLQKSCPFPWSHSDVFNLLKQIRFWYENTAITHSIQVMSLRWCFWHMVFLSSGGHIYFINQLWHGFLYQNKQTLEFQIAEYALGFINLDRSFNQKSKQY